MAAREKINPASLTEADMVNAKKDAEEAQKVTKTVVFLMFKAIKAATQKPDLEVDARITSLETKDDMLEKLCEPWLLHFAHSIDESFISTLQASDDFLTGEVKSFFADPEFSVEAASKQSHAAGALCAWIESLCKYAEALPEMQKYEQTGKALAAKLAEAEAAVSEFRKKKMADAESALTAKRVEAAHMETKDEQDREDLARLEGQQARCKEVILGLAEMCSYYEVGLTQYNSMRDTLIGDTIVFAAAVCYASHCSRSAENSYRSGATSGPRTCTSARARWSGTCSNRNSFDCGARGLPRFCRATLRFRTPLRLPSTPRWPLTTPRASRSYGSVLSEEPPKRVLLGKGWT